ncbi:MAG: translesion DNA synthesis-associated protein ImuA [Gammaproteobacteria bacterium]|nr:translesion DNA synthesis-associated protein ImuA [Gammaproteobacteria bacterium]
MSAALETLLDHPAIWRPGAGHRPVRAPALATGFAVLDAALPGGGWPLGALTEILLAGPPAGPPAGAFAIQGAGELTLVVPALARLAARRRWIVWVAPPHVPYAPALAGRGIDPAQLLWIRSADPVEQLWAAEQSLRSGSCGAVLVWPAEVDHRRLRRLQLAAEQGQAWGVVMRADAVAPDSATPAALRLRVTHAPGALAVEMLKCRGRRGGWIEVDAGRDGAEPATAVA